MNWKELKTALSAHAYARINDPHVGGSWAEMIQEAEALGARIQEKLGENYRPVGVAGRNCVAYLRAVLGILASGRTPMPLNTRLTPEETAYTLRKAEASGVIDTVALMFDEPGWLRRRKESGAASGGKSDRLSVLIHSSGSEGEVKAAELALDAMLKHARAVNHHLAISSEDSWLACLPFFHVGGLMIPFRCALAGAATYIVESADPLLINRAVEMRRISVISLVGMTLRRALDERKSAKFPAHLRAILVGGGPVQSDLIERCAIACPTYGMTESGSMLTCARPGCDDEERFSAGPTLPETRLRIVNDEGEDCKPREAGNILAQGPGLFSGYYRDEARTATVLRDGWLRTGDFGYLDEAGRLHVLARRTDLIISGGENIFPREIEAALMQHPAILQCVVLPVPDAQWGQVPGAVLVCASGRTLTVENARDFLRERLASYKHPRRVVAVEELPTLPTGKMDLAAVRKMLDR